MHTWFVCVYSYNTCVIVVCSRALSCTALSFVCSLFMSSARPRPSDHPLLVLFVVGGVTCWEVRRLREVLAAHHTKVQVPTVFLCVSQAGLSTCVLIRMVCSFSSKCFIGIEFVRPLSQGQLWPSLKHSILSVAFQGIIYFLVISSTCSV